jgi:hypothetical protein
MSGDVHYDGSEPRRIVYDKLPYGLHHRFYFDDSQFGYVNPEFTLSKSIQL